MTLKCLQFNQFEIDSGVTMVNTKYPNLSARDKIAMNISTIKVQYFVISLYLDMVFFSPVNIRSCNSSIIGIVERETW